MRSDESGVSEEGFEGAGELAGVLFTDEAARDAVADDFGHIVRRRPRAVLRPTSIDEVVAAVRFARSRGLRLIPRGQGHSTFGQSQIEGGLVLDMRALATIEVIAADRVRVGAGALWREVVRTTLAQGLRPPVLTDYLGLTVGGTLSVGGVGGESYRCGAQIDNVIELEVVTGAGARVTCSATREPELFAAVLAGLGQCGVIVAATLPLVPAAPTVVVFQLFYAGLSAMTADLGRLAAGGRFTALTGYIVPSPEGGWGYMLEAVGASREDAALLAGLQHIPGLERIEEIPAFPYADRISGMEAALTEAGLWQLPHPWLDLFVPASRVDALVGPIMAELTPADVGPLPVILYPLRRTPAAAEARPLLRLPEGELIILFDVLRTAPPDPAVLDATIAKNRELFERNRSEGGTHYPIGAIPLSLEDWQRHFGPAWAGLAAAKARFDPDGVLGPPR